MHLPVGRMEIARILRNLLMRPGDDIVQCLFRFAAVFHCDPAVPAEGHLKEAVVTSPGCHQNHGRIQDRVSAVPVVEIFIVSAPEEGGNRRLDRRPFLVVPVDAQDKVVADVACEPHVLDHARPVRVHERHCFARLDRDRRTKLCAVSAPGAPGPLSGRVFRGKGKRAGIRDHVIGIHG